MRLCGHLNRVYRLCRSVACFASSFLRRGQISPANKSLHIPLKDGITTFDDQVITSGWARFGSSSSAAALFSEHSSHRSSPSASQARPARRLVRKSLCDDGSSRPASEGGARSVKPGQGPEKTTEQPDYKQLKYDLRENRVKASQGKSRPQSRPMEADFFLLPSSFFLLFVA